MKNFLFLFAALALLLHGSIAQAATGTAKVGGSVSFSVTSEGTPPFTYQWRFNGVNIAGATAGAYPITSVKLTDAGAYDVIVSNPAGSATSDQAILSIAALPVITQQPASSQVISIGSPAALTVAAAGTADATFQWRKNGTAISGATASGFAISAVSASDTGVYDCVVSNAAGSVTSSACSLRATLIIPANAHVQMAFPTAGG